MLIGLEIILNSGWMQCSSLEGNKRNKSRECGDLVQLRLDSLEATKGYQLKGYGRWPMKTDAMTDEFTTTIQYWIKQGLQCGQQDTLMDMGECMYLQA